MYLECELGEKRVPQTKNILLNIENKIATITLNRPEVHNAIDDLLIIQFNNLLKEIQSNKKIRVLIVRSNGKHFSAGADLNWMSKVKDYTEEENYKDVSLFAQLMKNLYYFPIPTIALTQGSTFGGAVGIIACCDFAISSDNSKFCFPETKLGIIPAIISPFIVKAIGLRQTKRLFLCAEMFNANYALNIGLISNIVKEDELINKGLETAHSILKCAPGAVTEIKELLLEPSIETINDNLLKTLSFKLAKLRVSKEGQEGLSAFLNKTSTSWSST